MSFRRTNSELLARLQEPEHITTESWWRDYASAVSEQLLTQGGARFSRQLRGFLSRHMVYSAQGGSERREEDRRAALLWLTYQGYEETFMAAGRARVARRYFPEDTADWKPRAALTGVLFLLAREYLRDASAQTAEARREQTRQAVLLAEDWSANLRVPDDQDLEAIALIVWVRRCQDIARSMFRDELATWQHVDTIDTIEHRDVTDPAEAVASGPLNGVALSPAELFHKAEGFSVVSHAFLSACKDHIDRSILQACLEGTTEHETAANLSLTRAQVRGRWNTLLSRSQLLFKVISTADSPSPSGPLTTLGLAQSTRHKQLQRRLYQHAMGPKETASSIGFWLDWFRLSAMLEQEIDSAAPDQKENWNALVQVWRRALEKLLDPVNDKQDPLLLRELVAFWSAAIQLTDTSPLSPSAHHGGRGMRFDGLPLAPGARLK